MALFDDRRFLLSHINHSFITGDDTGICEVVMLDEDVFENQHQRCLKLEGQDNVKDENRLDPEAYDLDYESELFESEQSQSYDIASDLDYICHRRRSNTAQRLDRLKKEKINQSRTKTIVWRCNSPVGSQSEERLSQDSPISTGGENNSENNNDVSQNRRSRSPPNKSGLTRLLEKFPSLPRNPFDDFAQFDGGMSETVPVKKIMIFVALSNQQQRSQQLNGELPNRLSEHTDCFKPDETTNHIKRNDSMPDHDSTPQNLNGITSPKNNGPLEVVIVSTAKVQDLIGLICWQYTNEGREPKLESDLDRYCLRIAEDNGEVDPDFPSLNPKEALSKFNFPSLALTEKTEEKARIICSGHQYTNGDNYNHRLPTIVQNVQASTRISCTSSRLDALRKIIFKDAKLQDTI